MTKKVVLGIGEYVLTDDPEATVKTYALGSCVALILYNPLRRCLAMAHIALPNVGEKNPDEPSKIGYYADETVPFLLKEFQKMSGADRLFKVGIVGGAAGNPYVDLFSIGRKNLGEVTEHLRRHDLRPHFCDVGGSFGRTVEAETATGVVRILRQPLDIKHGQESVQSTTVVYCLG